jgi:hypothetical protein
MPRIFPMTWLELGNRGDTERLNYFRTGRNSVKFFLAPLLLRSVAWTAEDHSIMA